MTIVSDTQNVFRQAYDVAYDTANNTQAIFGCGFASVYIKATGDMAKYLKAHGWYKVTGQRSTYRKLVPHTSQSLNIQITWAEAFVFHLKRISTAAIGFHKAWYDYRLD